MNGLSLHVVVALLLASGCAHAPLDTSTINRIAVDKRNDVNELSEKVSSVSPLVLAACALYDDARCTVPDTAYSLARAAIDAAQLWIDSFAKSGEGLAVVEAGIAVIETALDDLLDATEGLADEVKHAVASADDPGNEDSGAGSGSDSEASGQPSPAAEGEGSAEAAGQKEASGGEAGVDAREERASSVAEEPK